MGTAELKFSRVFIRLYPQWCHLNYMSGDLCCEELLWHVGSSMAGCLAPRKLISPCYQLHPKTSLIPEVEGTDSLFLVTECLNLSFPKTNHVILQHKLSSLRDS